MLHAETVIPRGGGPDGPDNPGTVIPGDKDVPATGISFDKQNITLDVGAKQTLKATVTPENSTDKIKWTTGNSAIATVVNGEVTGVAKGTTTVTATVGAFSAVCNVTVNEPVTDPVPATGITLNETRINLTKGASKTLVATVTPSNSTDSVEWSVNAQGAGVVTVNNGVVKAIGVGTAVITAKAGEFTADCAVTVTSDEQTETGYLWHENFAERDDVPGYLNVTKKGNVDAKITEEGLSLTTASDIAINSDGVFIEHDFEDVLTGTAYVQMRIKFGNTVPFNNILFFRTADNKDAVTIAMDGGKFHNNNPDNTTSNKWAPIIEDYDVAADTWYDIELLINTEAGTIDFYVTDGTNAANALRQKIRIHANKELIKKFRMGGDKQGIDMTIAHIKVSNVTGPDLSLTKPAQDFEIDLEGDGDKTYTLEYSAESDITDTPEYAVTCDKTSGFTIAEDKKTISFTAAGTYTFTVTATDKFGSTFDTVTIKVNGNLVAPTVTMISKENATLSLQTEGGAKYKFEYTVEGSPAPADEVYCERSDYSVDSQDGVIKSGTTVTFYATGVYTFTVEASNGQDPTAVKTVTVTVTDKYALPQELDTNKIVYQNTFDSSDGIVVRNSGNANGAVAYDDGEMHITTNESNNGNYLFDMALGKTISGVTSVEMEFSINSDNANFTNLLFLQETGSTDNEQATVCFSVEGNKLKTHSGGSWYDTKYGTYSVGIQKNVEYKLRAVLDMGNNTVYLYLTGAAINLVSNNEIIAPQSLGGEAYLGAYQFRRKNVGIAVLRTGTNRANIDYTIDNVKIYQFTPELTVNENNALTKSSTYKFDYDKEQGTEVAITCADESVSISGDTATFTKSGIYTFTLTATNTFGSTTQNVTVICTDNAQSTVAHSVDFTNVDTRPELPTGTNANAEFTDNGLRLTTGDTNGSIAYTHDFDAPLSGIVTAEITFSIGENNNQFFNLLFFNDLTNSPICAFGSNGGGAVQHSPKAGSWISQQYNGKDIVLQKGTQFSYTLRVVADFDNGKSYLYLLGSNIKLSGTDGDIALPENGLFIASNTFRGDKTKAQRISTYIDNKSKVDYTVKNMTVKTYN